MKPGSAIRLLLLIACCVPVAATAQGSQIEEGQRLFRSQCGSCHGPNGNGGKGANLAQPRLRRATDDAALLNIIRRGIPGTEMPSSFLPPSAVQNIAAFVRSLGRVAPEEIPGDPGRGAEVFASQDCLTCHTLSGQGGVIGPALDDIGARRSATYLREAVVTPEAEIPRGFLLLRVVTRDGRELTGVRVNENAFSLQLRNLDGGLHSYWKEDLETVEKQWRRSPMVSYEGRLTPAQLDDLVSYLASLEVAP